MSFFNSQRDDVETPVPTDVEWIRGRHGGRYEIVRVLPTGGMAEAFVAMRHGLGGFVFPCCIKRMLGADREQFLQEAHILGKLNHDRIVRAFEVDEDEHGVCFIAMELVDGVNLSQLLGYFHRRCRRMPAKLAIYVADQVLEALGHAHHREADGQSLHIVHRDVTPSNILLGRDGYVKLADFGIARFRSRPDFTRTGTAKGKGPYMSPEHYDRRRGLDRRSDLFSLGATLYEMLAGERAFTTVTDEETLFAVLHGQFLPLPEIAPRIDPGLAGLVHSLLEPDKTRRPQDAGAVRERLRAFAEGAETNAMLAKEVEACLALEQATERAIDPRRGRGDRHAPTQASSIATTTEPIAVSTGDTEDVSAMPPSLPVLGQQAPSATSEPAQVARATPTSRRSAPLIALGTMAVLTAVLLMSWFAQRALAPAAVPAVTQRQLPSEPASRSDANAVSSTAAPPPASSPEWVEPSPTVEPRNVIAGPEPSGVSVAKGFRRERSERSERSRMGSLLVRVRAPMGYVWVDGRCHGRAPALVKQLAPGQHEVGASNDLHTPPLRAAPVDVAADRQTEVEVVLLDMFK